MANQNDLRIYFGDARIIIPAGDPRVPVILGMIVKGLPLDDVKSAPPTQGPVRVPTSDEDLLTLLRFYFRLRQPE